MTRAPLSQPSRAIERPTRQAAVLGWLTAQQVEGFLYGPDGSAIELCPAWLRMRVLAAHHQGRQRHKLAVPAIGSSGPASRKGSRDQVEFEVRYWRPPLAIAHEGLDLEAVFLADEASAARWLKVHPDDRRVGPPWPFRIGRRGR